MGERARRGTPKVAPPPPSKGAVGNARLLLENVPDHILEYDREGRILYINSTAPGFEKEAVLGTDATQYLAPRSRAAFRRAFEATWTSGKFVDVELDDVSDNGAGIPEEHRARIFEIFVRLHGQDEHPGTGVGLAIVRKAVQLNGGEIRVESEVGVGTEFRFVLPRGDLPETS